MQESSAPSLTRTAIDLRRFPWFRRLATDYAFAFDSLAPFFAGNPTDPEAWRDAIARTTAYPRDRERIADILQTQQRQRGAPAEAIAAAGRLRDPRTVAVLTGQQAGLFGGPLYTLLKSITAMQLAWKVERALGVPAIAIFWIDAEDHDWDEVASTTVLDEGFEPQVLTHPRPERGGEFPVASLALDASIRTTCDALAATLPRTEFTTEVLEAVSAAYRPGAGMADAFGQYVETLLGRYGLVLYNCADPAAKPLAARVFQHELAHPGRTFTLAAQAGVELERRGYHAQVAAHPDGVALFHLDDTGRHLLRRQNGRLYAGDRGFSLEELQAAARTEPHRFSPNVLTRPLVQDALFPTICYVGGPSELAYLGQMKGAYADFGIPMPLVHPRATATLLDSAGSRFLGRYDVALETLPPQDEAGLNRLLESQLPPTVEGSLHDATAAVQSHMTAVMEAVRVVDPTLEGAARSTLGKMEHELRTLHTKIIQAAKRRDDTLRRQYNRVRTQAFPNGHPQERTLGIPYFLNRYGPALVDLLVRDLPLDLGQHYVLTL